MRGPWASWDDYLATRSHNLRNELRRKERRLREQGLRHARVASREELEPALDALFALHRGRWGTEASPFFAGLEAFHRAFARAAFDRGWLRLRVLELEAGRSAANHGFRFGDASGRTSSAATRSWSTRPLGPGRTATRVRDAFAEGAREFRLGPGGQAYKRGFATGDRALETVGSRGASAAGPSLLAARRRGGG